MHDGQDLSIYHPDRTEEDAEDLELVAESDLERPALPHSDLASVGRVSLIPPSNASWTNGVVMLMPLVTTAHSPSWLRRRWLKENTPELKMMSLAPPRSPRRKAESL